MAIRYYVSVFPTEALIASQLEASELGDCFQREYAHDRCVPHEDGSPKHSVYLSVYRALEHIPLKQLSTIPNHQGRSFSCAGEASVSKAAPGAGLLGVPGALSRFPGRGKRLAPERVCSLPSLGGTQDPRSKHSLRGPERFRCETAGALRERRPSIRPQHSPSEVLHPAGETESGETQEGHRTVSQREVLVPNHRYPPLRCRQPGHRYVSYGDWRRAGPVLPRQGTVGSHLPTTTNEDEHEV